MSTSAKPKKSTGPPPRRAPTAKEFSTYLKTRKDFELEVEVFMHLNKLLDEVFHGGLYLDAITGKLRQFDVRATYRNENCTIHFPIECKFHPIDKPILILGMPRRLQESYHDLIWATNPSRHGAKHGDFAVRVSPSGLFPEREFVGKSIHHVGVKAGEMIEERKSNDDQGTFSRWLQAVSSGFDLVQNARREIPGDIQTIRLTYVQPILCVPDGTLWVSQYDSGTKTFGDPINVERYSFYLGATVPMSGKPLSFSHLLIFEVSKLKKYLGGLTVNDKTWSQLIFPWKEVELAFNQR